MRSSRSFTERLARSAALHPWRTIAIWVALIAVSVAAIGTLLGSGLTTNMKMHGKLPDSAVGQQLIEDRVTGDQASTDYVIVRSASGTVADRDFRAFARGLAGKIRALGPDVVTRTATYWDTQDPSLISRDRHATLIAVMMAGTYDEAAENAPAVHDVITGAAGRGYSVEQTGEASVSAVMSDVSVSDLERGEIFGVPAALVVLLIVFGAVLAASMPLVLSGISIVLAVGLTALIGQVYPMSTFVLNMLTMMGLAVCIDYALFFISRYREERVRGLGKIDAIAATGATANRAIFFSGMTVVVAMVGMVIVPFDVTIGMGLGVMFVVFTTLLTALILLPAVMGLLGDRVNALRIPLIGGRIGRRSTTAGFGERLAHSIMRRPAIWLSISVLVLLVLASPVLIMRTGSSFMSATFLPDDQYAKQGWVALGRDFSLGTADPLQIVVDGKAGAAPVKAAVARLTQSLKSDGRFGAAKTVVSRAGDLTLVTTTMNGDPAGTAGRIAVRDLRESIVPRAFAGTPVHVYVAGSTAGVVDYLAFFHTWLPIALTLVLSLSFVLLLLAFRSLVIPLKAILMNLLSVGAAYGVMVLVFQEGVGASLLGLTKVGSIEAWVPLFLFSVLFGLSMDYQVFLLSRIKERYDETGDTREAVANGVGRTAGIITGAAAIMVCVFAGLATGQLVMFQQMGLGLAVAVLLDATIVRSIVVPAAMELLGDWNWYLPRWLQWLPDIGVEGHVSGRAATPEPQAPAEPEPQTLPEPALAAQGCAPRRLTAQGAAADS